jgi:hypothetical protein
MTSQQPDSYETPCKYCIFAKWGYNTQIGCLADMLEKGPYKKVRDDTHNFNVVEGICTMYRTKEWNKGVADVEKARAEFFAGFTIIFDLDNASLEDLDDVEHSIKNIEYSRENVQVIFVVSNENKNILRILKILDSANSNLSDVKLVSMVPGLTERQRYEEIIKKIDKTFVVFARPIFEENVSMFAINELIKDRHPLCVVKSSTDYLYLLSKSVKMYYDQDIFEHFVEELINQAKKQGVYKEL